MESSRRESWSFAGLVAEVRGMEDRAPVVHSDPEILGGPPVFVQTRVPLQNLFDYLEHDYSLDEFLDDFPSVTRTQALAALEAARDVLIARARPA